MEGFRAVSHDLLDLKNAGTLYVAGDPRARHVLFFCAGFPDDHSAFAPLAARLVAERGCLVGLSCLAIVQQQGPKVAEIPAIQSEQQQVRSVLQATAAAESQRQARENAMHSELQQHRA